MYTLKTNWCHLMPLYMIEVYVKASYWPDKFWSRHVLANRLTNQPIGQYAYRLTSEKEHIPAPLVESIF